MVKSRWRKGRLILRFEELDAITRRWMLDEFFREETSKPYRDPILSPIGREVYPREMEKAIRKGDDSSLALALSDPRFWSEYGPSTHRGVIKTIPSQAAERLARNEFNTWYVRGLSRRLIYEGEEFCQVYRAAEREDKGTDCGLVENKIIRARAAYEGHRARLRNGGQKVFSIPAGEECYHTIRRLSPDLKAFIALEKARYKDLV